MDICFIQLFLVCCGLSIVRVVTVPFDHRLFLWHIFDKYGQNGSITFKGFERLYENLGLGNSSSNFVEINGSSFTENSYSAVQEVPLSRSIRDTENVSQSTICESEEELAKLVGQHGEDLGSEAEGPHQHCLSPRELLTVYGLAQSDPLEPVSFLHLCPAIVYQLDLGSCAAQSHLYSDISDRSTTQSSWLLACLSVLVISVSGLLCVLLVPLLHKALVSQLIGFLVALAVGTLLGDAFLHLIPHALGSHGAEGNSHTDSLLKTGLMFLTVVFFFTFEALLNITRTNKANQKAQNKVAEYVSVSLNDNERERRCSALPYFEYPIEMMEINKPKSHLHEHDHSNTALMVVLGDGLHNLTDGLAIGAAFSGGLAPGFATAVAVFTHELPHELGDFAVLLQAGLTVRKALFYNLLSSALSLFGTVLGLLISNFGDATQWVYAITAGCFIYIALSNLVPEINKQRSDCQVVIVRLSGILSGGALMACIAFFEHDLQQLFS